jgi:hypothetical protein
VGHRAAEEVFTRWYDIPHMRSAARFITVLDANNSSIPDQDLRRAEELSLITAFPDQKQELLESLAA